jgi:hypothetical protein
VKEKILPFRPGLQIALGHYGKTTSTFWSVGPLINPSARHFAPDAGAGGGT